MIGTKFRVRAGDGSLGRACDGSSGRLRPSNIDAYLGSEAELERIVGQIREQWPNVQIILLADSGFCRSDLIDWCDANGVDYILGLSRSSRLIAKIRKQMKKEIYLV